MKQKSRENFNLRKLSSFKAHNSINKYRALNSGMELHVFCFLLEQVPPRLMWVVANRLLNIMHYVYFKKQPLWLGKNVVLIISKRNPKKAQTGVLNTMMYMTSCWKRHLWQKCSRLCTHNSWFNSWQTVRALLRWLLKKCITYDI